MNNQLKRYDQWIDHENDWVFGEKTDGDYVLYSDVLPLIEALNFYRNEENWGESEAYAERMNIKNDARLIKGHYLVGGLAAAKALSKIGKGE